GRRVTPNRAIGCPVNLHRFVPWKTDPGEANYATAGWRAMASQETGEQGHGDWVAGFCKGLSKGDE
ncbi:MAG: hypothetical protein VX596_06380, partial [Pseudomonadota bacterium]|nr:hypothetical protein [Pseudomonadota bacterium]